MIWCEAGNNEKKKRKKKKEDRRIGKNMRLKMQKKDAIITRLCA